MMIKKFLIVPILLLILLSIGMVSATDDVAGDISSNMSISQDIDETPVVEDIKSNVEENTNESSQFMSEDLQSKETSKIETNKVTAYYKENSQLVGYLKDSNNQPISNKNVSIFIKGKIYNKITDNIGKFVLNLNLKPDTYDVLIKFDGDGNYSSSSANTVVTIKKIPMAIKTVNYKTYVKSDLYFKAKVFNKITKTPIKGVKVLFKVYTGSNKYKKYYAVSDEKGIATLKKNLKVGSYKVYSSVIKNKYLIVKNKAKSTLTVKATAETGCCSIYLQVSGTEAVTGFRRDSTYSANIYIKACKWNGRTALKQYKNTGGYSFHSITTADGWMMGTGGADNPGINKAIEKLAGKMVKSNKIKNAYLKKIQRNINKLGIGHFAIKAPNGKYAMVWGSGIYTGKLKAGHYLSVPNGKSSYRHGDYKKFSKDPADAASKIAGTDPFGVNKRDITIFHWKATTKEGSTTSKVVAYATNDDGHLSGRSTAHLKDNIYFKGKFYSKNKLPKVPAIKLLGSHGFKSIDKLIKTQTTVKVPSVVAKVNQSKVFKITLKNKKTKKVLKGVTIKLKLINGTKYKIYNIKTNSKGIASFNTKNLPVGKYNFVLYSGSMKYYISYKNKIVVEE